jgi:hypothetical protein
VQALKVRLQMLIKVENVLQEQISEIDPNHYRICSSLFKGCKGSVQTRDLFVFHLFFRFLLLSHTDFTIFATLS